MQRLVNHLPLFAILFTGGVLLAQSSPSTAKRTVPYVGYLEENGVAVNGSRDVGVDLFSVSTGGTACETQSFSGVTISEGRFQVEIEDIDESCLKTGELYLGLSVGPVGGSKTALSTSSGGRARVHAAPLAMANDKAGGFLAGTNGGILFERIGGQTKLFGDTTGATGVTLQPITDINDTNAIFLIKSSDGTERVRVNDNDAVTINEKLSVTGSSTLQALSAQATSVASLSSSGAINANGAAVNVTHSSNSSKLNFSSAGGSNNDPGLIEHFESGNTGELWVSTSDDWDGGTTNDRIVFGQRSRNLAVHSFDAAGNATHMGDLVLGGAISSVCPTGMSRIGSNCIDNSKRGNATFSAAMTTCNDLGKAVCTYDDLVMCDQLTPPGSDCDADTNNSGVTLWSRTRHGEREDFTENWRNNLMCYVGNDTVDECINTEQHEFYCCLGGIFSGTP